MYKKIIVLLLATVTLTHGADRPPNNNKRKQDGQAGRLEKKRRIDQASISGNEELSEQQTKIVRRLKAHSEVFKGCAEDTKVSDARIYDAIMIHQRIDSREGVVRDDSECELTEEACITSLKKLANDFAWKELSDREIDDEIMNSLESLEDDRDDDGIMLVPRIDLESMVHILKTAEDDSKEALINSCGTYVQGFHGADKEEQIITLLQAANYLDIPCMLDVCAKHAASYYADYQTLEQFVEAPQAFENSINALNIALELQKMIITNLLQRYKTKLETPLGKIMINEPDLDFTAVALNHDSSRLAVGDNDSTVRIFDMATGCRIQKYEYPEEDNWLVDPVDYMIRAVAYNHDGSRLATIDPDGRMWICDTVTSKGLQYGNDLSALDAVAFNHDSSRVAVGLGYDSGVKIYDVATGNRVKTYRFGNASIESVAYSPDGSRLVAGNASGDVYMWDTATDEELHICNGHTGCVNAVAFNHDGSRFVSASNDGTVRVWHTATGLELHLCNGHTDCVNAVAFNHDGSRFISASYDETVRMWDTATGLELHLCNGHTGCVNAVAFNHDGSRFVSASYDGTVRVWDIPDHYKVVQSLNLVQALYVYIKLSKNNFDARGESTKQYFEEMLNLLPDTIKRILDKEKDA